MTTNIAYNADYQVKKTAEAETVSSEVWSSYDRTYSTCTFARKIKSNSR